MEHCAGAVIVNCENKFLVIKGKTGFWGFPKGHVEPGEQIFETIIREVKEEVGLSITFPANSVFKSIEYNTGNSSKIVTFCLAYVVGGGAEVSANEEVLDYKWLAKDEALRMLSFDNIRGLFCEILKEFDDRRKY